MSAWSFAKATLFNGKSPACLWHHPVQALRVGRGVVANALLASLERIFPADRLECPVCGWRGRSFQTFLSADEVIPRCICPGCGSFDRHRQLVLGLRAELARSPGLRPRVMLGFSLSPALRFLLEREGLPRCFRSDVQLGDGRFAPDFVCDLQQAGIADASVDWIFCSHVLEHIPDLNACLGEMARILSPGGRAWLQVPQEPHQERSERIEIDPHRAHAHAWRFGQDFGRLIARPQWQVQEIVAGSDLDHAALERHGIDPLERYWLLLRV